MSFAASSALVITGRGKERGTIAARRDDPFETQTQSTPVAFLREFNALSRQRPRLAIEQQFGGPCRPMARAAGLTGGIAGCSFRERSAALFLR
jgi:hypothetical protein